MPAAIVTGASSGIGRATARALLANGFDVMLAARRKDRLEQLVEEMGERAAFAQTDVTDRAGVQNMVKQTQERFGPVDVLVNNAGIMPLSFLEAGRVDEWDAMIDVNLRGVLNCIHGVLGQMAERRSGHIVNVSSIAGLQAVQASGVYSATKMGVRAVSESLRKEMAPKGIRVTSILPGAVNTELGETIKDEGIRAAAKTMFDFDFLEPETIAETIMFALNQPSNVCVGEIVIRPTKQL